MIAKHIAVVPSIGYPVNTVIYLRLLRRKSDGFWEPSYRYYCLNDPPHSIDKFEQVKTVKASETI